MALNQDFPVLASFEFVMSDSILRLPVFAVLFASLLSTQLGAGESKDKPLTKPTKSASLDPKAATPDDIEKWIGELSNDAFTVRQAAASKLLAAGTPARDALVAVVDGPDPETRAAARRLVALIDRTEFHRRLEAFAADTEGKRGLTLPGWEQFRDLVGGDPAARALFVDMQRAEGPLLSAVFGVSSQPPEQLWEERLMRLVSWQVTPGNRGVAAPLGSCAAMLFLGSVSELDVSDRGAALVDNLIQRPPISEMLAAAAPQDAVRRLVIGWITHCPNKNESILARRLQLTSIMNLKEALPLALAVAGRDRQYENVMPVTRATAILVVGQFGAAKHVDILEPLLDDASVCMPVQAPQPGQPVANVQVRDVALVVLLHLTGQKPADYGYPHARLQPQQQPMFHIQTLHAANDQVRDDAVAKWKAWRAAEKGQASRVKSKIRRGESQEPEARRVPGAKR
ncbi:MAG: hypothetical protein L0228_17345 [Planctomycetes bacterium]|nr:hypothetical protein [Planctomycetota bacterium]